VIKRTTRAFGGEERTAFPELFSSSKRGKGLTVLEYGPKSISYLNKVQLEIVEQEKEEDDMTVNLCKQLRTTNPVNAIDPLNDGSTPLDIFLKQPPPPEPTEDQAKERTRRKTYDYIGTLSKVEQPAEDLTDFIKRSIFVQERRTSTEEVRGDQRQQQQTAPPKAPDATQGETAVAPPTMMREVNEPPKAASRIVPREETAPFDINEWIRGSVFNTTKSGARRAPKETEEPLAAARTRGPSDFAADNPSKLSATFTLPLQTQPTQHAPQTQQPQRTQQGTPPPGSLAVQQQVRYIADGGMFIENQSNILHLHATSSGRDSSVCIQSCNSSIDGNILSHLHIHGPCRELIIRNCQRIVVLLDQVCQGAQIVDSDNVRISFAGSLPPHINLLKSPNSILHSVKELSNSKVQTSACPASGFILVSKLPNKELDPEEILVSPTHSQVILPENSYKELVQGVLQDVAVDEDKLEADFQALALKQSPKTPAQAPEQKSSPQRTSPQQGSSPQQRTSPFTPKLSSRSDAVKGSALTLCFTIAEDFYSLENDVKLKSAFFDQFRRDLAFSLHTTPDRFEVTSLLPNELSIYCEVLPDTSGKDPRSPQQLGAQIIAMSRDKNSFLRSTTSMKKLVKVENPEGIIFAGPAPSEHVSGGVDSNVTDLGFVLDACKGPEDYPVVKDIVSSGPAAAEGSLAVGDVVLSMDGTSCQGKDGDELNELMSGLPGTSIGIRARDTDGKIKSLVLERQGLPWETNKKLAAAAGLIADSFKSPAYKTRKAGQSTPRTGQTYQKVSSEPPRNERAPSPPLLLEGDVSRISSPQTRLSTPPDSSIFTSSPRSILSPVSQADVSLNAPYSYSLPPSKEAPTSFPAVRQRLSSPPPSKEAQLMMQPKFNAIRPAPAPGPSQPRVRVTVTSARNLPVTEKYGLCSSYVIMAIGNQFHKTGIMDKSLDPIWNQTFEFAVQPALMQGLLMTLTVEDKSALIRDEPIGQLSIPLLQLMMKKKWEGWFDLRTLRPIQETGSGVAGVFLSLVFLPENVTST